ncbi:GNAT family N-acetyltransferase [Lactococcus nasutitermitis]|uniref:GNAT family N-acetyltransferase n=1 Tax=Lactococcus nasutitermitis TaxID=1652957 RepID=A0ABV9JFU5_9LACT|nr:GNAT family N-acetyltransferase [Lactococcus nasutitermitis]
MDRNLVLAEHENFETERLRLRRLTMADAAAFFDLASNDEVARFVPWEVHKDLEETKAVLANVFLPNSLMHWGVVEKASGRLIGEICLIFKKEKMAEFGWEMNHDYWGQGMMPEAARVLRDFCFDELECEIVTARHMTENQKSGRVMEKIGMHKIGQSYDYFEKFGKVVLLDNWAITREEVKK